MPIHVRRIEITLMVALAFSAAFSQASTWYVSKLGSDTNAGDVSSSPFASVTNAVAWANPGDLIAVSAGVYTQSVVFAAGKASIMLKGGYDPTTWEWNPGSHASTILGSGGAAVTLSAGAASNTIAHLTLTTNGKSYDGIEVTGVITNLAVEGVSLVNNRYGFYGGWNLLISLVMKNTLVAHNDKAGIFVYANSGTLSLYNCTVADNNDYGVDCRNTDRRSDRGVMVPVIKNSIFANNKYLGVYKVGNSSGGSFQHCLFYGNGSGSATGQMLADLGGNKCGRSPEFADPVAMDYQLLASSPAAAAGTDLSGLDVTTDLLGVARPQGSSWDMGAYESSAVGEGALSRVVYVSKNGSDETGDGTSENPWSTISFGLGHVADTGTVIVAGGLYEENVRFGPGNNLCTIMGGYDPVTWSWSPTTQHTVVSGGGTSPVQLDACANDTTLSSVTLTGGTAKYHAGVLYNANIYGTLIDGCVVSNNTYGVAGVLVRTVTVRNTLVVGNTSDGFSFSASVALGGGVCNLYNCTVAKNGGYGYFANSGNSNWGAINPIAKNCLFTDNASYGISVNGSGTKSIASCLFFNNGLGTFSGNITDLGNTLTASDPLYVDAELFNYRLQRLSPAVDSGADLAALDVTVDLLGVQRPLGAAYDRGAYERSGFQTQTVLVVR